MASETFNAWHDLGYTVFYVTGRGQETRIGDGRTAEEATWDWLEQHHFPVREGTVHLAPGGGAVGEVAEAYKSERLAQLHADGWTMAYAYGDTIGDVGAAQSAGVSNDHIFHVGVTETEPGVQPLPDDQAYGAHLTEFLPGVASACDG